MKNNKGSSLVMVMIVSAVLIIFAVTLGSISITETKQVIYQEKKTQAYYIARSAAESAATWITNDTEEALSILGEEPFNHKSDNTNFFDVGKFNFEISGTMDKLNIKATGIVENGQGKYIEDDITLVLDGEKKTKGTVIETAVYSESTFNVDNQLTLKNDLTIVADSVNIKKINGDYNVNEVKASNRYKSSNIPKEPNNIDQYFPYIDLKNEAFTITVNSNHKNVVIENLKLNNNSSIEVEGNGVLNLFINDIEESNNVNNFKIIPKENEDVKIQVYFNNTSLAFKNNIEIVGNVYTNAQSINFKNNTVIHGVIFAPHANIDFQNNLDMEGAIVADFVNIKKGIIKQEDSPIVLDGVESGEITYIFQKYWK